jgi:transcriptional regulator with XRE-family HTH domain
VGVPTLRDLRLARALSQRDLAEQAGVAPKTVVDLELGRKEPQLKTIRKLAAALGVELARSTSSAGPSRKKPPPRWVLGGAARPVGSAPERTGRSLA